MNDAQLFEDLHSLAHSYIRWCAYYKKDSDFESYLREHEPIRYRKLTKIYKFLEEMYE